MTTKACEGASTRSVWKNMEQCRKCGTSVRFDLVGHPFWGFQNCREKQAVAEDREARKVAAVPAVSDGENKNTDLAHD